MMWASRIVMVGIITVAIVVLAADGCHINDPTNQRGQCQDVCSVMRQLSCVEGHPIDKETRCDVDSDCGDPSQTCAAHGHCIIGCVHRCETEGFNVSCLMAATTCEEVGQCFQSGPTTCSSTSCPFPNPRHHEQTTSP